MIRIFHRWPGLLAGLVVLVVGFSGAALSVFPGLEYITSPQATRDMTVDRKSVV